MIRSFRGRTAELLFSGRYAPRFLADLALRTERKPRMLDAARTFADLRIPPANRLELLQGDRGGQHSIRIDEQWRICFVWRDGHAHDVEIVDDH